VEVVSYKELIKKIKTYIQKEDDLKRIEEAYQLALFKHEGQFRRSGYPYITHPMAVTYILAELNSGPNTLIAALLHDLVEDTNTDLKEIKEKFGEEVAALVDGVTKISKLSYNKSESEAENHQKMLLAMSKDIRVILIKVADRLHNMRTIDYQLEEKKERIANETLDIFAPLAHRLGLFNIKAELEDISLRVTNPPYYYRIQSLVKNQEKLFIDDVEKIKNKLSEILKENKIKKFKISGRTKSIYSIYKKMALQNRAFEDIYDILALRIIVDKIEACYQTLGIVHANFIPIPNRFKDFIAVPKENMYQSLHTTVITSNGSIFEIQIRTEEMDRVAEYGVAAHWAYKEGKEYSKEKEQFEIAQKLKWYRELSKMAEEGEINTGTASEFVESVKSDILADNVYVFTPKGQVIELTTGSTPIDFAYRIHTDVGDQAVGAKVNNKIVPLDYHLQTGDVVTIRTNKNSPGPSEDWLSFVRSSNARHKIRNYLNRANRDNLYQAGKLLVEKEAVAQKADLTVITDDFVKEHFSKNRIEDVESLYVEVGKGILSEKTVISRVLGKEIDKELLLQRQLDRAQRILTTTHESGIVVEGLTSPQIRISNCCSPVYNDPIMGFVTRGSGIAVHHKNCPNLNALENERLIEVYWADNISRQYPTRIQVSAINRDNLVGDIISKINARRITIAEINAFVTPKLESIITLKILVPNLETLEKVMLDLMGVHSVYQIERKYV
jgi:guanosine-3',5'-bis(diphosphate) 3'-pyrophosphohydrolase